MVKISFYPFILFFILSCKSATSQQLKPQEILSLDSIFSTNFAVLDSVVGGTKKIEKLSHGQIVFLYIISEWAGNSNAMDFSGTPKFTQENLIEWRKWFNKNSNRIDLEEYRKCYEIHNIPFEKGLIVPDSDLEYLDKMATKYKNLN